MREAVSSGSFSRRALWLGFACALGCSDAPPAESIGPPGGGSTQLRGAVQKGPFVIGSSITLSVLDAGLNPTGLVFNTQTINDRGEFEVTFDAAGPISLQGDGFHYNEVLGQLSSAAIALRAFYVPNGATLQQVYVNMVTHLTTERIKALVSSGTAFSLAVAQSESELHRELSLTGENYAPSVPGTSMNLAGEDNPDNAYLLAVSSTMLQLALEHSSGSVDATLQESLNVYSLDFADGSLEPQRRADVQVALGHLNVAAISENLAVRLAALGSDGLVPNMEQVLDQDGDGVANIDDVCPRVADDRVVLRPARLTNTARLSMSAAGTAASWASVSNSGSTRPAVSRSPSGVRSVVVFASPTSSRRRWLRDITRRTQVVVSCLEVTWAILDGRSLVWVGCSARGLRATTPGNGWGPSSRVPSAHKPPARKVGRACVAALTPDSCART